MRYNRSCINNTYNLLTYLNNLTIFKNPKINLVTYLNVHKTVVIVLEVHSGCGHSIQHYDRLVNYRTRQRRREPTSEPNLQRRQYDIPERTYRNDQRYKKLITSLTKV